MKVFDNGYGFKLDLLKVNFNEKKLNCKIYKVSDLKKYFPVKTMKGNSLLCFKLPFNLNVFKLSIFYQKSYQEFKRFLASLRLRGHIQSKHLRKKHLLVNGYV